MQFSQRRQPMCASTTTRSPTRNSSTVRPTATTSPAYSCPKMNSPYGGIWGMPWWMIFRSVPQTPQARTRTRASSSPGTGTGRSSSSNRCGATSTVAFIVLGRLMAPPLSRASGAHVPGVVPEADHRLGAIVVLVAEHAQARGAEHEQGALRRVEPEPAGDEHAEDVSAREEQHVSLDRARTADDPVGSRAHLGGRFPAGAAVAEEVPARALRVDLGGAHALVVAVIPFEQVTIDLGRGSEAGQFAGPGRALQGAREHLGERVPLQPLPECLRVALAALGQGEIGEAGVLARQAPGGLAVTGQVDVRSLV